MQVCICNSSKLIINEKYDGNIQRVKMKPVHVVLNKNKCSDPDQSEAEFSPGSESVQFEQCFDQVCLVCSYLAFW